MSSRPVASVILSVGRSPEPKDLPSPSSRPSVASGGICCTASLSSKEEWKTAHADENAFAAFSIPLFFVMVSVGRSPKPKDLLHSLTFHRKRNGKPLMLIKTHSLPFPFLFLCSNTGSSRRLSCHLERQSRGLIAKADSSAPDLRSE